MYMFRNLACNRRVIGLVVNQYWDDVLQRLRSQGGQTRNVQESGRQMRQSVTVEVCQW